LRDAQLRISDSYLLIDEGNAGGFGLPTQWLDGAAMVARPGREAPALRIFYRDGAATRNFTIRFRGGIRSLRRACDAERVRHLLLDLGLPDRPEDRDPSAPDIRVPWEESARFERENVIWRGKATAPVLLGEDIAPADVWLTTRSLIWSTTDGDGINRLALDAISDVVTGQIESRVATPAVYLAFLDVAGGHVRFDLPFVFDQYSDERNSRERGAFLVGLRSRGVALGLPVQTIQPWRSVAHRVSAFRPWLDPEPGLSAGESSSTLEAAAISQMGFDFVRGLARQLPTTSQLRQLGRRRPDEQFVELTAEDDWPSPEIENDEPDVVLAEFSAPEQDQLAVDTVVASADIALASDWYEPLEEGEEGHDSEERLGSDPVLGELDLHGIGDPPRLEYARAYEAANLSLLSEALVAIGDRGAGLSARSLRGTLPSQEMERAAFAELGDAERAGELTHEEAEQRKVRLHAISEATRRLRSLVELRDSGHLTDADLAVKQAEISDELSGLILAGSAFAEKRNR
jgi:hypothetical protein